VLRLKPIKTTVGIVGLLLVRQKQRKTVAVRKGRPSGAKIVSCRGLRASVQHDDKCGIVRKGRRSVAEHSQIAEVETAGQTGLGAKRVDGAMVAGKASGNHGS